MSLEARHPRNPLAWEPVAAKIPADFPFGMQRDNAKTGATGGSKQFSGFKSEAALKPSHTTSGEQGKPRPKDPLGHPMHGGGVHVGCIGPNGQARVAPAVTVLL